MTFDSQIVGSLIQVAAMLALAGVGLLIRGYVVLFIHVHDLHTEMTTVKASIPPDFRTEWAVFRDRAHRTWDVLDANSGQRFADRANPVTEEEKALFAKKAELGIGRCTTAQVYTMIRAMDRVRDDPDTPTDERIDAKMQLAYLNGVLAERETREMAAPIFPSIEAPEARPSWWRMFV